MASENETVADIVNEMQKVAAFHTAGDQVSDSLAEIPIDDYADRIEAAHRREVETARIAACSAQARFDEVLKERDAAIAELRECLKNTMTAMCNYCRSTPEAKGLPCLNGCETMLAAKHMVEVVEGGES